MTTDYEPLTPEQADSIWRSFPLDVGARGVEFVRHVEAAAIENYLAQKGQPSVPDEIVPFHIKPDTSLEKQLSAQSYCDGWNACRAEMLAAAPTPPAPKDAQVGKDAERYRALAWAMETNDKDARLVLNKYLEPTPSRETVGKIADELIAIAAAKGKE